MEWDTYTRETMTGLITSSVTFGENGLTGIGVNDGTNSPFLYINPDADALDMRADNTGSGSSTWIATFNRRP